MRLEVIIKDKETGEIRANVECDSVVCGYSGPVSDDTTHSGLLTMHKGNILSAISAIGAAEEAVAQQKKYICEVIKKETGEEVHYELIEMVFRKATSRIEVDVDAIKSMMEGIDDEH